MKLIDYTEPEHGGLDKYVDESNWVEKVPTTPIRLMKYSRHIKKGAIDRGFYMDGYVFDDALLIKRQKVPLKSHSMYSDLASFL